MSALLAEDMVPARHLRVIEGTSALQPAEDTAVPASLLRPTAPRAARPTLATVTPLRPRTAPAATASAPRAVEQRIVLTRRGVAVMRAAVISLLAVFAVVAGVVAGLALRPAAPVAGAAVVVGSGESLWSIAAENSAPGQDVRTVMADIVSLNGLTAETLHAGQTLVLPAR